MCMVKLIPRIANNIFNFIFKPFKSPLKNKYLLLNLLRREIYAKFKNSYMGLLWIFIIPLIMIFLYTFIFSFIFQSRVGGEIEVPRTYFALQLFSSLVLFNFFSDTFVKSISSISSNVNYVKKIIFPLDILCWVNLGESLFNLTISLMVWFLAYFIIVGVPNWHIIFLPLILLPYAFFIIGTSWIISSISVFVRDLQQVSNLIITILLFSSPIFYNLTTIPEKLQKFLFINPLTAPIVFSKQIFYEGTFPDLSTFFIYSLFSVTIFFIGFCIFNILRKDFSDVL